MISRIEDDEVAYKEEFLEEQEEMKSHLVESLALQRTNSLSARFRRQRSQEIDAEKIKNEVGYGLITNEIIITQSLMSNGSKYCMNIGKISYCISNNFFC